MTRPETKTGEDVAALMAGIGKDARAAARPLAAELSATAAFLELGGSDPVVVLDSADPDMAAEIITRGATENSGRLCCAIERVYHGILDQVTKRTVARMQALGMSMQDIKQGDLAR